MLTSTKSAEVYKKEYDNFNKWFAERDFYEINGDTICLFLNKHVKKGKKVSTLWKMRSMIKNQLILEKNLSEKDFEKSAFFLKNLEKKQQQTTQKKKAKPVFTKDELALILGEDWRKDPKILQNQLLLLLCYIPAGRMDSEIKQMTLDSLELKNDM